MRISRRNGLRVETGNVETASSKVSPITSYNRGVINSAKPVLAISVQLNERA
jgi:hypothetical protein